MPNPMPRREMSLALIQAILDAQIRSTATTVSA